VKEVTITIGANGAKVAYNGRGHFVIM